MSANDPCNGKVAEWRDANQNAIERLLKTYRQKVWAKYWSLL